MSARCEYCGAPIPASGWPGAPTAGLVMLDPDVGNVNRKVIAFPGNRPSEPDPDDTDKDEDEEDGPGCRVTFEGCA